MIVEKVSVVTKEPANNPGEAEGAQEMPVLIPFPVLPGSFVCLQEMPVVALHSVVLLSGGNPEQPLSLGWDLH